MDCIPTSRNGTTHDMKSLIYKTLLGLALALGPWAAMGADSEVTPAHAEEMVSALKKLSKDNLANLTPHPFHTFLNASHPPILERIEALRAKAS